MRRLFAIPLLLSLALVAAPAQAVVKAPGAEPTAVGKRGAAASVDPYATKTAIDVLAGGGNAVDAAVAAAAVLGVVEPYSSGVGGGGFMLIRTPSGKIATIDGRETAPGAYTETSLQENGEDIDFDEAVTSGLGVGIPGTPATWDLAVRRYGSRPLARALKPAIKLATKGFVVDPTLQAQTEDNAERFAQFPATARIYLPGGRPIQAGATLRNPDLAATMALMARRGVDQGFYRRAVAKAIVKTVRKPPVRKGTDADVRPGVMKVDDLRRYKALPRKPTRTDYRGMQVVGMGPPSSGGTTVGESLNILESLGEPSADPTEELHRYLEATRLAYADRSEYLGDPAFTDVPVDCLLSQPFADTRAALIAPTAATSPVEPGDCASATTAPASDREGLSTTHLTVVDRKGMIVTYTFTIEQTGGSGIVVPGRGFLLNNELTDFDFAPGTPNSPGPRHRPRSSMSPTVVLQDGEPVLALGSPGGSSIITTVLQVLVNRYERGLSLPEAVAAPRASERNVGPTTEAEPDFISSPEGLALVGRGHRFAVPEGDELGALAAVEIAPGGRLTAAAEPERRGGGSAMVVKPKP